MRWLLRWLLSDADRRAVESDLEELYEFRRREDGDRAAARWLRRQQVLYPLHLMRDRMRSLAGSDDGRGGVMSGFWRDVTHSARSLRRSAGLTATIVLTVGLGLGATTAMVTVIRAVVLNPLPYADQDALMWVYSDRPPWRAPVSVADYRTLDEQQTAFSSFAGYQDTTVTWSGHATASRVRNRNVTWAYFSLLGQTPAAGRLFDRTDDAAGRLLVVLSHEFWTQEFGADPSIVGRTIPIDGVGHVVAGVVRSDTGPIGRGVAFFRPVHWGVPPRKGPFFIRVLGRLRPGVTQTAALDELRAINRRMFPVWQASYQDSDASFGLQDLKSRAVGSVASTLVLVLAAVGCVLLIACVNAINLLLARAMRRGRELAIRVAMGASRRRIQQYLAAETLLLATGSAAIGLAIAAGTIQLIATYGGNYVPRIAEIRLSGFAFAWLAGLSVASALVIGLVPALHSARVAVNRQLPSGGRGATDGPGARRFRRVLIGAEFAIATPLIIAAALLMTSLHRLMQVPVGIDTAHVLTAGIALPQGPYPDAASAHAFWDRALARVAALPGVESVSLADSRPPSEVGQENNFDLEDHATPPGKIQPTSPWAGILPGFFGTAGLALQQGRLLDDRDYQPNASNAIVVDRAWADRFFPNESVLGRRLRSGGCTTCDWTTVVGVVGTVKYLGLDAPDQGTVYWPMGDDVRNRFLLVRAARPAAIAEPLRQAMRELDPNLALSGVATIDDLVSSSLATPRYLSVLIGMFGAAALALSIVGVYGVMAYFVQQHRRDIGIRLALGGDPARVWRLVIGQGLTVVAIGIAIGVAAAFFTSRIAASALFGVGATDPLTMVAVPTMLMAAAIAACAIPAARAAAIQPAEVLKDA